MSRVRTLVLGSSAVVVAVAGVVLLWMVRTEASRLPGEAPLSEPAELAVAPGMPAKIPLPPPKPRPTTAPHLRTPNPSPAGLPSMAPMPPSAEFDNPPQDRDQMIEQRRLASLERRARAIQRRMDGADRRGVPDPEKVERDRIQMETLMTEIRMKRTELGLANDFDPQQPETRPAIP